MSAPFSFLLSYSRRLLCAIGVAHLLPLLCIGVASLPSWVRLFVAAGVCASLLWHRHVSKALRGLRLDWGNSGEVWLRASTGDRQIEVLADSVDLGWLIVLHWRERDSQRHGRAALTRDAFTQEHWRALRRRLRWNQPAPD